MEEVREGEKIKRKDECIYYRDVCIGIPRSCGGGGGSSLSLAIPGMVGVPREAEFSAVDMERIKPPAIKHGGRDCGIIHLLLVCLHKSA